MRRVVILMYHQVERAGRATRMCCPLKTFQNQMDSLGESGRPLVTLSQVVRAARGEGDVPHAAVAVTFDDGYAEFFDTALPALHERQIPATLFAVAGKLGGSNDWVKSDTNSRRALMSGEQLRQLPGFGVDVGSHSMTHPKLPEIEVSKLQWELQKSRAILGDLVGHKIELLAYPYGHFDKRVRVAAEEAGYEGACSTRSGFNADGEDPLALRRIDVYGTDSMFIFNRKLDFGVNDWALKNEFSYRVGRIRRYFQPISSR